MKRFLSIAVAGVILAFVGFTLASALGTGADAATPTTATTGTTTTATTPEPVPTTTTVSEAEEAETTSGADWLLIAIEGLIVVAFIALGVRTGGIGLGLFGRRRHARPRLPLRTRSRGAALRRDADHRRGDLRRRPRCRQPEGSTTWS